MKQIAEKSMLCLISRAELKRDRIKKFSRKSVLKMLAVMEASHNAAGPSNSTMQVSIPTPEEAAANEKEFLTSGRTGRRNALPDILGQNAVVSSGDLSTRLQGLTTNDNVSVDKRDQPGTSKS